MKRLRSRVLFLLICIYPMCLPVRAAQMLVPGGQVIGLRLENGTVTVAAFDDSYGDAARQAGLRVGDTIEQINGVPVCRAEDVRAVLERGEDILSLTIRRGSGIRTISLSPRSTPSGQRLGVYLKQGISGIGTVTWYDPHTGRFGALGHGVNDSGGMLLNMTRGKACYARVAGVKRGACGEPGQLRGIGEEECGILLRNTPQGIVGTALRGWPGEAMLVAEYDQIRTGDAAIRSTVDGTTVQEYSVEILKIYPENRSCGRNFLLKVTDQRLLNTTGGIVQGMSGSPIIQDGKLVGAVTHVLVNDPTRGYGIFIENMLETAG